MSDRCFTDEELGEMRDLSGDDPRRIHLRDCPRCSTRLAQFEAFLAAESDVAEAHLERAREYLDRALEREIGGAAPDRQVRGPDLQPRRRGWTDWLTGPRLRPVLAAAALVIVVGGAWWLTRDREQTPAKLRGEQPAGPLTVEEPRALEGGGLELSWSPMRGADRYQVRLVAPDLTDLAALDSITVPHVELRHANLPARITPGTLAMWQVVALRGRDTLGVSLATPIRVP